MPWSGLKIRWMATLVLPLSASGKDRLLCVRIKIIYRRFGLVQNSLQLIDSKALIARLAQRIHLYVASLKDLSSGTQNCCAPFARFSLRLYDLSPLLHNLALNLISAHDRERDRT